MVLEAYSEDLDTTIRFNIKHNKLMENLTTLLKITVISISTIGQNRR